MSIPPSYQDTCFDPVQRSVALTFITASNKRGKKANFFVVTADASDENVQFSSHEGQEFLFVLEGTMEVHFKDEKIIMREGDSVFFNSSISHAIRTVDGARAKFLSVLV